ncbi:MAG: hypothetical protein ACOYML_01790 [Microthrixaceae bacterium]
MIDPVVPLFGLATTVGPLPFSDPSDAVEFALRAHERFPTVPVLSDPAQGLLAQAVDGLTGVGVATDGTTGLVLAGEASALESVDGAAAGADVSSPVFGTLHQMLGAVAGLAPAPVALRVGVLGPVTLALALRSAGVPDPLARELAAATVTARSTAIVRAARAAAPATPMAVVLSEPGLVGCIHPTFPFGRDQVRTSMLDLVVDALDGLADDDQPVTIGLHVPGRTDWDMLISSGVSLISLPADPEAAVWSSSIGRLIAAGGSIAWGAVPVDRPLGTSTESLWKRLAACWAALSAEGIDPMELRLHSLVSTVDGLAHFDAAGAGRVVDLCTALSSRLRRQSMAARLSLGA